MKDILDGKSLLITGGTGSFGQYLISKILNDYDVKRLVVYSRDELKQFDMQEKFQWNNNIIRYFIHIHIEIHT